MTTLGPVLERRSTPVSTCPLRLRGDRNALTVDVEDWYHNCNVEEFLPASRWDDYEERVTRNTRKILGMLDRFGVRATFFVLGYIAHRHPDLVREVARSGHEIGTHGYYHRRVFRMTPEDFRRDLRDSLDAIASATDSPVKGYRAPMWSIRRGTLWAISVLREEGILYDSSIAPVTGLSGRDLPTLPFEWVLPGGSLREFPVPTTRCFWENLPFSGGLPLRFAPYWYVLTRLRKSNREGTPGMVYIHPWEFDEAHPRMEIPFWSRFFQVFNLRVTPPRVEDLLKNLEFAPLAEVMEV